MDIELARKRIIDLLDSIVFTAIDLKNEVANLDEAFERAFTEDGESDFDQLTGIDEELGGLLDFARAGCTWEED